MQRLAIAVSLDVGLVLAAAGLLVTAPAPRPRGESIAIELAATEPVDVSVAPARLPRYPGACSDALDFKFAVGHVGADGIPEEIITRTFDAYGRPIHEDWQRDDAPHRTLAIEYAGNRRVREVLRLFDGSRTVWVRTWQHDRAGRVVVEALDEDVDGTPDWLSLRSYDREGRLASLRENVDARTRRGGLTHWYRYDDSGLLQLVKTDNEGDGVANLETRYEYDARGRLLAKASRWYGRGDDVPIGERFTYTYDGDGRVLAETDRYGFAWRYRYDEAGNLLVKEHTPPPQLVDRTPFNRTVYDYHCWR